MRILLSDLAKSGSRTRTATAIQMGPILDSECLFKMVEKTAEVTGKTGADLTVSRSRAYSRCHSERWSREEIVVLSS
jgi:hypothetical protein